MITTVLFDMGGTLEDIWVDAQSERAAIEALHEMLIHFHLDPNCDDETLKRHVDQGWAEYAKDRDQTDIEQKPVDIWCKYALRDFHFSTRSVGAPLRRNRAYVGSDALSPSAASARSRNARRAEKVESEAGRDQQHGRAVSGV